MRKPLFLLALMLLSITGWAQEDITGKLSITSQMFLQERNGDVSIEIETMGGKTPGQMAPGHMKHPGKHRNRIYAAPDTINGCEYISCFVRLDDMTNVTTLASKGVQVQCQFQNGLVTALIPVDSLESVARLTSVRRINVSPLMRPSTDQVKKATNVDDLLTNSADAVEMGLTSKYDGEGVVLGVIDTGIDFQHIAFKDKNGNSRIKRAYVYNGSSAQEYTSVTSSSPTTDDSSEDHGTHTSSTAGGSSVIVNGSSVTVTDDHANATYGGMAPGADLYLAGIKDLSSTYLANAMKKMCDYADAQGKPLVVSNSWGSQFGPHDGTGDVADVVAQYFGDQHPNHICLFAASNDAGKGAGSGDGYHIQGTASSSSPLRSVLRSGTYSNTDDGYYYYGLMMNAWTRSKLSSGTLACRLLVIDSSTGEVKTSVTINTTSSQSTVSGLSTYYSGTLYVLKDYISSSAGKSQFVLYAPNGLTSRSTSTKTINGSTYYVSNYSLAVELYPTSGSTIVDAWGGTYGYFSNSPTNSSYNWVAGSDDCSVSDEATDPNVISIGAYVSKNNVKDYNGSSHDLSSVYTMGDIAYFSSYQKENVGPTGAIIPWISAPGATTVSAVNHYHTSSGYVDDYYADYGMYRVNSNTTNPYGSMEGTSMATPAAAGIVALWLQAAVEAGKELTTTDVKNIMRETAITDGYTNGTNGAHFGNGKIDALAGVQYILGASKTPVIKSDKTELSFSGYATRSYTQTLVVKGANLEDKIEVSLQDESGSFAVSATEVSADEAAEGKELTVTWTPTVGGNSQATLTLSSEGAASVDVNLQGVAVEGQYYTITYNAGTGSCETASWTQEDFEQETTLPEATITDDWTFEGWSETPVEETTTKPTLLAAGSTYLPAADVTLYAVYSKLDGEISGTVYRYTTTLTPGNDYLFVTANTAGSAYVLDADKIGTSGASSVTGTGVTIQQLGDDLVIVDPTSTAEWTTGGSSSSLTVKNGSYYLRVTKQQILKQTSSANLRWSDSYGLYYQSNRTYYFCPNSSNINLSTSSSSRLYLFEKGEMASTKYTSNPDVTIPTSDITRDGEWDITDVTALVDIILGKITSEDSDYNIQAADINGDGEFTVEDVTLLVDRILNKE